MMSRVNTGLRSLQQLQLLMQLFVVVVVIVFATAVVQVVYSRSCRSSLSSMQFSSEFCRKLCRYLEHPVAEICGLLMVLSGFSMNCRSAALLDRIFRVFVYTEWPVSLHP